MESRRVSVILCTLLIHTTVKYVQAGGEYSSKSTVANWQLLVN